MTHHHVGGLKTSCWGLLLILAIHGDACASAELGEEKQRCFAREVLAKSGDAYRQPEVLEDRLTLEVETPEGVIGTRIITYRFGPGADVSIEIDDLLHLAVTDGRLLVERGGVEDRVLDVAYSGDLAAALKGIGVEKEGLVGCWEPPQQALRCDKGVDAVADALRYTVLLNQLHVTSCRLTQDGAYEIRLDADNGHCLLFVDAETRLFTKVACAIRPLDAPDDYEIKVRGAFQPIDLKASFQPARIQTDGRESVARLHDLAPAPMDRSDPPNEDFSLEKIQPHLLTVDQLANTVLGNRILLVGEDHRFNETVQYLTDLMECMDDRPIRLLLEMPGTTQPLITRYLETGDEQDLQKVFEKRGVLPYQHILRWARQNRHRLSHVAAVDEHRLQIAVMRCFLTDSRNRTMAKAIVDAYRQNPQDRIVAYGGQLHMMKSGRYRFDQPNRETIGPRLLRAGIPPADMVSIMLSGSGEFALSDVWVHPGALHLKGGLERTPYQYLLGGSVFGATSVGELCDYFVNLGPLTRVAP